MRASQFDRMAQWITASAQWSSSDDSFIMLNVQMLGTAEQPIAEMEQELCHLLLAGKNDPVTSRLLTQHKACVAYWMLGFYELLRILRKTHKTRFTQISDIFRKVSVIRMPLAKHEMIGSPGFRQVHHYPVSIWCPETGKIGWSAFDPETTNMLEVFRCDLADQFLAIKPNQPPLSSPPTQHI